MCAHSVVDGAVVDGAVVDGALPNVALANPADRAADLLRHVSAEQAALYLAILEVFARAKRQYRLQLRPDEVLAEARWRVAPPALEAVNAALVQLTEWGNLESHPDTARVSTL